MQAELSPLYSRTRSPLHRWALLKLSRVSAPSARNRLPVDCHSDRARGAGLTVLFALRFISVARCANLFHLTSVGEALQSAVLAVEQFMEPCIIYYTGFHGQLDS